MKRIYNYLKRGEKGFTLVELLIVVIILAVLSGIAVPSYMALRNRARESA
ncbi:MAG: type IV pilin protein, partial [Actinomycetota bacterium]